MEKGDGKRAHVVGEGWVVEGEMTCSRMDGAAAKMAAPSSRTDSAISEERPGYFVVAASKSVKNSIRMENPWYTNHARVDTARGERRGPMKIWPLLAAPSPMAFTSR